MTDSAPRTAAELHVLRHLGEATAAEVLELTLKELVLRRVWRLERRERAGLRGFRSELALARGIERAPALTPLMQLDAALGAAVGPETVPVSTAVKRVVRARTAGGDALLAMTRDELERRELVRVEERRALRIVTRRSLLATEAGREALAAGAGDPFGALDTEKLPELEDELRRISGRLRR